MVQRAAGFTLFVLLFAGPLLAVDINGEVRVGLRRGLAKPATVLLLREMQVVNEQFTDLDGRFEFHSLERTSYVVRARYEDLPEIDVRVEMARGTTRYNVPITIVPPKSAVGKTTVVSVDQLRTPRAAKHEYEEGLKDRKAGNCGRAIPHLRKAVNLEPKYGEAFNELGNCLKQEMDWSGAEAAYQKAVDLHATIYPSINLSDLYAGQKRFEEAGRVIRLAISKDPVEGDLFFALGRIYFDQDRLKEAEQAALEAHSRIHRTADVHLLLAKIYLSAKNYPALKTQLETYLVENPSGPVADQVRKNLHAFRP